MFKYIVAAAMACAALPASAQPKVNATKPVNKVDTASYAIGTNIGTRFTQDGIDINPDMLAAGMRDAIAGKSLLTDEQIRLAISALQEEATKRMAAKQQEAGADNRKKSESFLAENKKKQGVITTPSGLQYKVDKAGTGPKPTAESTVKVHYTGTLLDGKVFDSSVQRGEPATFPLNAVIRGWTEGLQLMPVGSKYTFYIPSDLAYGAQGSPGAIGPEEALTFEVELLEIVAPSK